MTFKMARQNQLSWLYSLAIILVFLASKISCTNPTPENTIKSSVHLSPPIQMKPGLAINKLFYNIKFPKGHIGIKSFNAELVDEAGKSISLTQTYIHHWAVLRYYHRIRPQNKSDDIVLVKNDGVCSVDLLGQYFGMGSESRKTKTFVPDPYAIEVGNQDQVPKGYYEGWVLNVHAIDVRGVVDTHGCTECRCDLFNVTKDESGRPLSPGYEGGFHCCYDQTQCKVKGNSVISPRKIFLRYTVKWVDWEQSVVPVRFYIFDVTDVTTPSTSSVDVIHHCKFEYEVEPCRSSTNGCKNTSRTKLVMPKGGNLVYGVGLQYPGGLGTTLYRKDGQVICSSIPRYGKGKEVGNEYGFIVGMSTCYPKRGSIKINDGETIILESIYNSSVKHTGAAGFMKIMVADS